MWEIDRYPKHPLRMTLEVLQLSVKLCPISIKCNLETFEIGSLPIQVHEHIFVEHQPDNPPYLQGGDRTQQLSLENEPLLQRLFDEYSMNYPEANLEPARIKIVDKLTFYNSLDRKSEENSWEVFNKRMQSLTVQQRSTDFIKRQLKGLI